MCFKITRSQLQKKQKASSGGNAELLKEKLALQKKLNVRMSSHFFI
jgi:hypothetical protein